MKYEAIFQRIANKWFFVCVINSENITLSLPQKGHISWTSAKKNVQSWSELVKINFMGLT